MKKENIVKENREFDRIIKTIKPFKYKEYLVFLEQTSNETYHFGISVSKKICNAVGRNKIKRQIRSIIDKKHYKKSFNCIIIVNKTVLEKSYLDMANDLYYCFDKLKIIEGENNEK